MRIYETTSKSKTVVGSIDWTGEVVKVSADGVLREFPKENVSKYMKFPEGITQLQMAAIRFSDDEQYLKGLSPVLSEHPMSFNHFKAEADCPPTWTTQEGGKRQRKDGSGSWMAEDKAVFSAILVIVDGVWKGVDTVLFMDYLFKPDKENPNLTSLHGSSNSAPFKRIKDFLRVAGLDLQTDNLPHSDNVLPNLESLLQAKARVFRGAFNAKGYIEALVDQQVGVSVAGPAPSLDLQDNPLSNALPGAGEVVEPK